MHFATHPPPADLRHIVRFFWEYESNDLAEDYVYRSMADGCVELIFTYKGHFSEIQPNGMIHSPLCHIHGPSRQFHRFFTQERFGIFGAYLYPFAIPAIFGHATKDCQGQLPTFEELCPAMGKTLADRLLACEDMTSRMRLLIQFLRQQLSKHKPIHTLTAQAIQRQIQAKGAVSLTQWANEVSLSQRQFERRVKDLTGFSPKTFTRILRFQAATANYQPGTIPNLTQLGLECGYYDQAHFIHDFQEFSGYHPRHFFAGLGEGMEYRDIQ